PELADRIRLYGLEANCRGVDSIGWFVDDMVRDPESTARDAQTRIRHVMETSGAETVVLGCTIVAACYELAYLRGAQELAELPVINPNLMAVKVAELFADLAAMGQYRISRRGYYQQHAQHDPAEAAQVLTLLETPGRRAVTA
ncbi:MAG: aspartate/glutamate racemase family protein, partial [Micromonosporaceae bacterium]